MTLDPRLNAFRPDLADERLRDGIEAARYVKGQLRQIIWPVVSMTGRPDPEASQISQALMGETCLVFEDRDGWAWIQLTRDHYVGYVQSAALTARVVAATHKVRVASTLVYPRADLKSHPVQFISMNAEVKVNGTETEYSALQTGGYIFTDHLALLKSHAVDFVEVAAQFLETPYYWGGKTFAGIDCSGLVQTSLHACGKSAPRDSDMQQKDLGTAVNDIANLQRGDLVFWKGHVGIMKNATELLEANGHHMKVTIEPLAIVAARNAAKGSPIVAVRRLSA